MAAALNPQQKDTVDPFWVSAARQLFSNGAGVLWEQGERDNRVLVEHGIAVGKRTLEVLTVDLDTFADLEGDA